MNDALTDIGTASRSPADQKIEADRRAAFDRKVAEDTATESDRRSTANSRAASDRESELARRADIDRIVGPPSPAKPGTTADAITPAPAAKVKPIDPPAPDAKAAPAGKPASDGKIETGKKQAVDRKRAATRKKWVLSVILLVAVGAIGAGAWLVLKPKELEAGFVSGNGRIEATEVEVSPKLAGRIAAILVNEGDFVTRGQIVARMDTKVLEAQRAEAVADLAKAQSNIVIAQSQVAQQLSSKAAAAAVVVQRRAELNVAGKRLARSRTLSKEGAASVQDFDNDVASQQESAAAIDAAVAQVAAADAAILTARAQVTGAQAGVVAASATIQRIDADIDDSALRSPLDARVQYRVAQPDEVLAAGGIVLDLVDLTDVYMTLFLPDAAVGRVALATEVRIVLDAAPEFVVPAKVSFVADVAQFTPKTVETASERQKLVFRIKAQIDPALLHRMVQQVKTGLPGIAYVRLDATKAWPDRLAVHVPD